MTIETPFTVSGLKKIKNSVIGNPTVKRQWTRDAAFVQMLVQCLNCQPIPVEPQGSKDDVRIEAAHIISSLSYGSEDALGTLLRADAMRSLLLAINKLTPIDPPLLKAAFARALRTLTSSLSEVVGPSQWGLAADSSTVRDEAKAALDYLFETESLDVYLPLLVDSSHHTSASIALLIGSAVRTQEHRDSVTEWAPYSERVKEVKTKRGWEKTAAISSVSRRHGGWVVRNLSALLSNATEYKYQEALLLALSALVKENTVAASALSKPHSDKNSVLHTVQTLAKSRIPDVQLAACLCAIHTLRENIAHGALDESAALNILNVINRMIATPFIETIDNQRKACFLLYYLVNDDAILSRIAYERGALERLSTLVHCITPPDLNEREEDEPESMSALREAALTAIASLAMFENDIRQAVADEMKLLPIIEIALSHRHIGVRYAACQCIRAISRGIAVLRTNLVDTGIGMLVFGILKKEDEDRRVLSAALSAVCNIVNDFSPLKQVYIDEGLLPRLMQLIECGEPTLRLSALWAIKNVLTRSSRAVKQSVIDTIGWPQLFQFLSDTEDGVQEQALNILRNICTDEASIQMVFDGLGVERLLELLVERMEYHEDDVVCQAVSLLANLANGFPEQIDFLLTSSHLLTSLQSCLSDPKSEIRRPAVACILQLARTSWKARTALLEIGMDSTLRYVAESRGSGIGPGLPHHASTAVVMSAMNMVREDERDIMDHARWALDILESAKRGSLAA